jgi:hypothetical protein
VSFLWQHLHTKEQLLGMLLVQNVEAYFRCTLCKHFESTLVSVMRQVISDNHEITKDADGKNQNKEPSLLQLCLNEQVFKSRAFEEITRDGDFTNWGLREAFLTKNGERYESDSARMFFESYIPVANRSIWY